MANRLPSPSGVAVDRFRPDEIAGRSAITAASVCCGVSLNSRPSLAMALPSSASARMSYRFAIVTLLVCLNGFCRLRSVLALGGGRSGGRSGWSRRDRRRSEVVGRRTPCLYALDGVLLCLQDCSRGFGVRFDAVLDLARRLVSPGSRRLRGLAARRLSGRSALHLAG